MHIKLSSMILSTANPVFGRVYPFIGIDFIGKIPYEKNSDPPV